MLKTHTSKPSWLVLFVLIVFWAGCASLYQILPDQVPSHWNVHGEIDGYSPKAVSAFVLPLIPLVIYLLLTFLPNIDPRRENYHKFASSYKVITLAITGFMVVVNAATLLPALGYNIHVDVIMQSLLPLLMIILGNYMGKIRPNYFVGIRTPWTLDDDENWHRTHRFAGKAMVLGGLFAFTGLLFSATTSFVIVMSGIFIPLVAATGYSYWLYKIKTRKRQATTDKP